MKPNKVTEVDFVNINKNQHFSLRQHRPTVFSPCLKKSSLWTMALNKCHPVRRTAPW